MNKKNICLLLCFIFCSNSVLAEPTIESMKPEYIDVIKEIILGCWFEFQFVPFGSLNEVREFIQASGSLRDIEDFQSKYMNAGAFFVAIDNGIVVGAGAMRKVDDETAELRRFYFLKEYRGQGLGSAIVEKLIETAREYGYKKLRLEIYDAQAQQVAISFYKKFGFYEIPPYRESDSQLSMEALI